MCRRCSQQPLSPARGRSPPLSVSIIGRVLNVRMGLSQPRRYLTAKLDDVVPDKVHSPVDVFFGELVLVACLVERQRPVCNRSTPISWPVA